MKVVIPQPGEGWPRLLLTPRFNGGDEYPPQITAEMLDATLPALDCIGIMRQGTPSVMFTMQQMGADVLIHWVNDGRTPLDESLDLLDSLTYTTPLSRFVAFVRRPALVRLLASRGWTKAGEEWHPYMAMMTCQRKKSDLT